MSLIEIHIVNDKQCRSRSVGFFRSGSALFAKTVHVVSSKRKVKVCKEYWELASKMAVMAIYSKTFKWLHRICKADWVHIASSDCLRSFLGTRSFNFAKKKKTLGRWPPWLYMGCGLIKGTLWQILIIYNLYLWQIHPFRIVLLCFVHEQKVVEYNEIITKFKNKNCSKHCRTGMKLLVTS